VVYDCKSPWSSRQSGFGDRWLLLVLGPAGQGRGCTRYTRPSNPASVTVQVIRFLLRQPFFLLRSFQHMCLLGQPGRNQVFPNIWPGASHYVGLDASLHCPPPSPRARFSPLAALAPTPALCRHGGDHRALYFMYPCSTPRFFGVELNRALRIRRLARLLRLKDLTRELTRFN